MAITIDGTNGITLPSGSTGVGTTDAQILTNKTLGSSLITSATAVASTSGTAIQFTAIPSWVKRITVMLSGVSTSGTNSIIVQLGTGSTTYTTSGYLGIATAIGASSTNFTTAFVIFISPAATSLMNGIATFVNLSGNTWAMTGSIGESNGGGFRISTGSVPLSAQLTAIQVTTVGGTDTFDAGSVNILYE